MHLSQILDSEWKIHVWNRVSRASILHCTPIHVLDGFKLQGSISGTTKDKFYRPLHSLLAWNDGQMRKLVTRRDPHMWEILLYPQYLNAYMRVCRNRQLEVPELTCFSHADKEKWRAMKRKKLETENENVPASLASNGVEESCADRQGERKEKKKRCTAPRMSKRLWNALHSTVWKLGGKEEKRNDLSPFQF